MTVDPNDPSYRLAQAALDAANGNVNAIADVFEEIRPSSLTITRAYALCLSTRPYNQSEATRLIVGGLHYAVAEKAAAELNILNRRIVVLTVVLVVFGVVSVIDICLRLFGHK